MRTAKKTQTLDEIASKPLPNATDLEELVLGALLLDKNAYFLAERWLRNENIFYSDKHKKIFQAIKSCIEKYHACDIVIVTQELRKRGQIDNTLTAYDVTMLTSRLADSAHIEAHAAMLHEKFIAREIIRGGILMAQQAYQDTEDVFLTLDEALKILHSVETGIAALGNLDFRRQVTNTMQEIQEASRRKSLGIPTGMRNVDAITGGRVKGELTIIAARPSMGKTARMIQEAMNIAIGLQTPVGIISLEMTYRQLITRKLSNISRINSQIIRSGRLTNDEWTNLVASSGRLADSPFYINDISDLTISDIRGIIRNWAKVEKVEIVFLDYIGLIKFQNQNGKPVDEISKITRGLKTISQECSIPVVALAQLNREVEKRADKRPVLSDLRDSGSIEQDADVVSFLYRPEYYGIMADDNGETTVGLCEENIAKNRNGIIGKTWHRYIKEVNEFQPHKEIPIEASVLMRELPSDDRILEIAVTESNGKAAENGNGTADDLPW